MIGWLQVDLDILADVEEAVASQSLYNQLFKLGITAHHGRGWLVSGI